MIRYRTVKCINKFYAIFNLQKIVFLFFFTSLCKEGDAQEILTGFRIGLSGSTLMFNTTDIYGNTYEGSYNSKYSISGGVTGNFEFLNELSLQSEILLQNKGYNNGLSLYDRSIVNLWHLHFPEYLRYSIPIHKKSKKSFFLEVGPYFSWLFYSKHIIENDGEKTKTDIKGAYTATEYGMGTGAGFRHPMWGGFWEYNMRYEFSMSSVLQNTLLSPGYSDSTTREHYRVLALSFSYCYSANDVAEKLFTGK